ncbi:hypothetical protein [Neotamlana sedimentorum]|uniref:hypothetical protein n=1 Tax=Neotamlana sedimentorum TaxID=1435349 RepID=UPI00069BF9D6|nr:hypothetical protein [Tamlana sedimentorum]
MSYQAILRASDNSLVADSNVSIKIIIHQNDPSGEIIFEENHAVSTNSNGLVSLEIGTGSSVLGSFNTIPWQQGSYFVETQADINGGTNYNVTGVSQLLSVPYALHAKTAESITGTITAVRANVIAFTDSRSIINSDINNTIACTRNATLTLSSNFSEMAIGDTINLEAHNGATLTVSAATGVSLNYTASGSAVFASEVGNVRFGLLRKSGENAYIISGQ